MNQPDNSEDQPACLLKNARKIGGFLLLGALLLPGISCRKAVPVPAETAAMHPAAEAVAQAEQQHRTRGTMNSPGAWQSSTITLETIVPILPSGTRHFMMALKRESWR